MSAGRDQRNGWQKWHKEARYGAAQDGWRWDEAAAAGTTRQDEQAGDRGPGNEGTNQK